MTDKIRIISEEEIKLEFKELMLCLKAERNRKFPIKVKDLAVKLSKTINYISAIENGNEFPSMKLFINFLLLCNFDLTPLKTLKIKENGENNYNPLSSARVELINKILSLNEAQLRFLIDQAKISTNYNLKKIPIES